MTKVDDIQILKTSIFKVHYICPWAELNTFLHPTLCHNVVFYPSCTAPTSCPTYPILPHPAFPCLSYLFLSPKPQPTCTNHILPYPFLLYPFLFQPILPYPTVKPVPYIIPHTYPILLFCRTSSIYNFYSMLPYPVSLPLLIYCPTLPRSRVTVFGYWVLNIFNNRNCSNRPCKNGKPAQKGHAHIGENCQQTEKKKIFSLKAFDSMAKYPRGYLTFSV